MRNSKLCVACGALFAVVIAGCSQVTGWKSPVTNDTKQTQPTQQATRQYDLQKPQVIYQPVTIVENNPGSNTKIPASQPAPGTLSVQPQAELDGLVNGVIGVAKALASNQQSGLTLNLGSVTVGDTSGSASQNPGQTATGGAMTSTASPAYTATQTPTATVTAPLNFGFPGSANSLQATGNTNAAGPGGNATGAPQTSTQSPTQTPTTTTLTIPSNMLGTVTQLLQSVGLLPLNQPAVATKATPGPVTSPPATQTAN